MAKEFWVVYDQRIDKIYSSFNTKKAAVDYVASYIGQPYSKDYVVLNLVEKSGISEAMSKTLLAYGQRVKELLK